MQIEISEYGRPIVWVGHSSWYGGKATITAIFTDKDEAIKWASFEAQGFVDWANFPDPARQYPYDDRDGSEVSPLTPVWRVHWDKEGGGYATVTRTEVSETFNWAAPDATRPPLSVWHCTPNPESTDGKN